MVPHSYLAELREFLLGPSRRRGRRQQRHRLPALSTVRAHASRFTIESLEPRLLLDATPLVLPVETIVEQPHASVADAPTINDPAPCGDSAISPQLSAIVSPDNSSFGSSDYSTFNTQHSTLAQSYGVLPLSFEANQGQTNSSVEFLARGQGYSLFLTGTEAVLTLRSSEPSAISDQLSAENSSLITDHSSLPDPAVLRLTLEGANAGAAIAGRDQLEGRVNYLIGSDATQWHTDIPTYERVFYDEVYQGIDLVFYGNQRQLEYDWVVAPGADANQIGLGIEGASSVTLDAEGDLQLVTVGGTVELQQPYAYQVIDGTKQTVAASYVLSSQQSALSDQPIAIGSSSTVRLQLGAYDAALSLIIDPILIYSTYLGGSSTDEGQGIAVDAAGNAYVTGRTSSLNFPVLNVSQPVFGGAFDAFVTKLNAAGTRVYSTYLGGSGDDAGQGIAVDAAKNAYVVGDTSSLNFPTLNASQLVNGGGFRDAFVTKLDAAGARVYSTYLGGSGNDQGKGIAVDAAGQAYVTGFTDSSIDFPTPILPLPGFGGGLDAFVTRFNALGARVYSTYLGGIGTDVGRGIAVDAAGAAYVTGLTDSINFPTTLNASQGTNGGGNDAFVTKLNTAGARVYSTYLGGSGTDEGLGIDVDAASGAWVTGHTDSTNFPTLNASQTAFGGASDAFVTRLDLAGARFYSTYLGGSGNDVGQGIAVDVAGQAYVTGWTGSTNFPTLNASQPANGGPLNSIDAFVTKLKVTGAWVYSTYLGGSGSDAGQGIAVDAGGGAYVTGYTDSTNFPTLNASQGTKSVGHDAFVTQLLSDVIVTNTADSGAGSFRQAIIDANAHAGLDQIVFAISGGGVHTIQLGSTLAAITGPLIINGWSQGGAGYTGPPLIELNGTIAGASVNGLTITGSNSTVRGLVINGFSGSGIVLSGTVATGNQIQGNYIGINAAGTSALANGEHGIVISGGASNNIIGGTTAGARNVISGNALNGIDSAASTISMVVQGNFIGTDATGLLAVPNQRGVNLGGDNHTIGGTTAAARNIISGNTNLGIHLGGDNNTVAGNFIGTNVNGTAALGNGGVGVALDSGATGNRIGGTTGTTPNGPATGASNVISGNQSGIAILNNNGGASANFVEGNYIGTDATGLVAIANTAYGINIAGSDGNIIGSGTAAGRNIISGNTAAGIYIEGAGSFGNVVQGNYIGLQTNGNVALPNGSLGVRLVTPVHDNTIGGTTAGSRNIISGNGTNGIAIVGAGATGNLIQGNYIGTNAAGAGAVPNTLAGVEVQDAVNTTIGGTAVGAGNQIAYNDTGVRVTGTAVGNRVQGNVIHSNGGLGIDLAANGVTANDVGDADTGANNLQNFPVLTNAAPGSAIITGTLTSAPNTQFTIEFFSNPVGTGDPTGFGEGRTYLGRIAVTTNASGDASFSVTLTTPVIVGELVTATATDPLGNTSEFSQFITVANNIVASAVLNVTTNGSGTGRITSLPPGIDTTVPGAGFSETYPLNTIVRLTATPTDPDGAGPLLLSTFGGWSGAGISSTNPVLDVTMDQARTLTATFNPAGPTAPPVPVVDFVNGFSNWANTLTITWSEPPSPPTLSLLGYHVRVGTAPGIFGRPIFVQPTKTSLTLLNVPTVQHFYTVSALWGPTGSLAGASVGSDTGLEPLAAPLPGADFYAVQRGGTFQTVPSTGVLSNDTDPDGQTLTARIIPASLPLATAGTVQDFLPNGTFIFESNPTFTGTSVTFQYEVSDNNGASYTGPVPVTVQIVQESGQSQQGGTTPAAGLAGWTIVDEGTVSNPSHWLGPSTVTGVTYQQFSAIDTPSDTTAAQRGTNLYETDGLAEGRINYVLTLGLRSSTSGALGVLFRYIDENNYYRFSMDNGEGYRRLIKMQNGVATVLPLVGGGVAEQTGLPSGSVFVLNQTYPLEIEANGGALMVTLRDPEGGPHLVRWTVNDATPFINNGFALYSARHPGANYDLLGVSTLENPTLVPLEVRTTGTGVGTVTGRVGTNPMRLTVPGAPVASYAVNTPVTLTAAAGPGSTFTGWTGPGISSTNPVLTVTMNQAKIVTAQFDGAPIPALNLDVDGSGEARGLEDGIVIVRYLLDVRGPALIAGAINQAGTRVVHTIPGNLTSPVDTTATAANIATYLSGALSMLDVDGSGEARGLEDGIVIVRYLLDVRGPALIAGAINQAGARVVHTSPGVVDTIATATALANFLAPYQPVVQLSSQTAPVTPAPVSDTELAPESVISLQPSAVSPSKSLSTQDSALGSEPSAHNSSGHSSFLIPHSTFDDAASSSAIAATQLSPASVRSAPWVSRFLAAEEDEELVVMLD